MMRDVSQLSTKPFDPDAMDSGIYGVCATWRGAVTRSGMPFVIPTYGSGAKGREAHLAGRRGGANYGEAEGSLETNDRGLSGD
jgi:hypothetical protein